MPGLGRPPARGTRSCELKLCSNYGGHLLTTGEAGSPIWMWVSARRRRPPTSSNLCSCEVSLAKNPCTTAKSPPSGTPRTSSNPTAQRAEPGFTTAPVGKVSVPLISPLASQRSPWDATKLKLLAVSSPRSISHRSPAEDAFFPLNLHLRDHDHAAGRDGERRGGRIGFLEGVDHLAHTKWTNRRARCRSYCDHLARLRRGQWSRPCTTRQGGHAADEET